MKLKMNDGWNEMKVQLKVSQYILKRLNFWISYQDKIQLFKLVQEPFWTYKMYPILLTLTKFDSTKFRLLIFDFSLLGGALYATTMLEVSGSIPRSD